MRIIDLPSGMRCIISNEEALLLDKISDNQGEILKHKLEDREAQVAKELVQRGVLTRVKQDGKLVYKLCDPHIWRI